MCLPLTNIQIYCVPGLGVLEIRPWIGIIDGWDQGGARPGALYFIAYHQLPSYVQSTHLAHFRRGFTLATLSHHKLSRFSFSPPLEALRHWVMKVKVNSEPKWLEVRESLVFIFLNWVLNCVLSLICTTFTRRTN